jgi:NAD(P)-dependent dehydrogenase (short-subunit alcohol dehydrogenase family)
MQTWLITGTSSGFGRAMTQQLLERGDRVAATLRRPEALQDLVERYGDQLWVRTLDVTDTAEIRRVVAAAFDELGRIDVVVSNAGYGLIGAAEELSDAQIDQQIQTNIVGSVQLIRAVTPYLRAQGGGTIQQLSSMGGQVTFPGGSLYHLTKWAMEGFVESYAAEVATFGIQTTLVEPGGARTQFSGGSLVLAEPLAAYEDTPAGMIRRMAAERFAESIPGDPEKIAAAMIAAADEPDSPRRLLLGSDAWNLVTAALEQRLEAARTKHDLALSTDADDYVPGGGLERALR